MSAPLTNAVLTKITAAGALDRSGDPGVGATLWTGRAAGYLKRVRRNVLSGGVNVPVRTDSFTILNSAGAPVLAVAGPDWEATTVTVEDRRTATPVTRKYTVKAMEHRQVGSIADSVRLELDAEAAP